MAMMLAPLSLNHPAAAPRIGRRWSSLSVIRRSRALARRLEGWPRARFHRSRLAEDGEHLRMTVVRAAG